MAKIDYKKEFKHLYRPSAKNVSVINVPPLNYLMIDGEGNPNTAQAYEEAVETLFAASYTLKFMIKKSDVGIDYTVMPLEGLWWTDDMALFSVDNKDIWKWTSMIMQPEFVTDDLVADALQQVEKKKNPPALSKIRFETLSEGQSAQIMHIGSYADEAPTIEKLHNHITKNGFALRDKHHEIYLSDPRRAAPEKMKTVIRQPMELVSGGT